MRRALVFVPLFLTLFFAPVSAQIPTGFLYEFSLDAPQGWTTVPPGGGGGGQLEANLTFHDYSGDAGGLPHRVRITVTPEEPEAAQGWSFLAREPEFTTIAGETRNVPILVNAYSDARDPYVKLLVNATIVTLTDQTTHYRENVVGFFFPGAPGFASTLGFPLVPALAPREIGSGTIEITNRAPLPRQFQFQVGRNDCGILVSPPASVVVLPKEMRTVGFTVAAPSDSFWYQGNQCSVQIDVIALDTPASPQSQFVSVKVEGFYIDPTWVFWLAGAVILLLLLIFLIRRRKEMVEEEILGKPQKPWMIPVEKVYLSHLKRKDPRAWYVVRHYLMEDEYRSSLLWYRAYKAATKGDRKKERLILDEERHYAKQKARWKKSLAKPLTLADRYEAKLQRRLDRKARRRGRRELRTWRKKVRDLKAAHRKALERAGDRHEKAVRRAAKKGLAEPPLVAVPTPVMPPEPRLQTLELATHRWSKKAARYRSRMERRQGNLEVRNEKADARYQARLRRRVQRIARKLDDPQFVDEHPMLRPERS